MSRSIKKGPFAAPELLKRVERTAADEEYIFGVYLYKFLIRMLASALRGNVCNRSFKDFKQCLLYALTRNVTRDRTVFASSCYLVYLVDIDNTALGKTYVIVGCLN